MRAIAALAVLSESAFALPASGQSGSSLGMVEGSVCPDNSHAIFHACALEAARTATPPSTPEGRPDFNGYWLRRAWAFESLEAHPVTPDDFGGPSAVVDPADGLVPMQDWAVEQSRINAEQYLHHNAACILAGPAGTMYMTSRFQFIQGATHLVMVGVPRITYLPYPFQIVQTANQVTMLYEYSHVFRNIYIDSEHPPGPIQWWMGDSRAQWEGDTLVVDVVHFTDRTWFDRSGNFHSEDLHVVERYTLTGPDHIRYEATIEDPKVFSRPWTMSMPLYRRQESNIQILEYECGAYIEEARDAE